MTRAETAESVNNVLIGLYSTDSDTAFNTLAPDYITRTDNRGHFKLNHLKAGDYQIVALEDKNGNYYYDLPEESIAFENESISLTDSTSLHIDLRLFKEETAADQKIIHKESDDVGYAELIFAQAQDSLAWAILDSGVVAGDYLIQPTEKKDTVFIWYKDSSRVKMSLLVKGSNDFEDTISIRLSNDFEALQPPSNRKGNQVLFLHPHKPARLSFRYPIMAFDPAALSLMEDSIELEDLGLVEKSTVDPRILLVHYDWKAGATYQLSIGDSSLLDFFGQTNDTTISIPMIAYEESYYGNLSVKIENRDTTKQYIFQLWSKASKKMIREVFVTQAKLSFPKLSPGKYDLKIIEDTNGDGKWTTGKYAQRRQAEPVFSSQSAAEVKGNWDTEISISVGNAAVEDNGDEAKDF